MCNADGDAHTTAGGDEVVRCDRVDLTLATANTHREAMERFTMLMQSPKDGMIVVADDRTGSTEYFTAYINACATIDIDAQNAAG